ncbi:hypothetical protein BpHYR1_025652 [Brachionus plicatilis]|uniref:Uncharacterized protein n=1 Tax=Brachionus plicatilis TaxID=10195 RepID=A0A3M7SUK6_BRAPC|nr:hypothetical protein BpHYR1_025652 [Brachionus plicatilis]
MYLSLFDGSITFFSKVWDKPESISDRIKFGFHFGSFVWNYTDVQVNELINPYLIPIKLQPSTDLNVINAKAPSELINRQVPLSVE